ncbi:FAD-linked oxidoreductase patO [Psilocybe cubensis]|uniref:FAD-binding PCMH-type domain-containing protein n=2 Tax=Psilocybe cubensis TaxID=181762 RepID=A0A8H7Y9Q5_PSICU|nr:FAD-linked oxidoreductase patO [Psilocybe cubensis]KAH9486298.1 FAD-linked oxidoreductase patO [Psilocybe cubensis]
MHLKQALLTAFAVSGLSYANSVNHRAECKCGPTDECWPSTAKWAALNNTVDGRLIKTIPIGSVCHNTTIVDSVEINTFDAEKCAEVQANWHFPQWHELSSSSIMTPWWSNNSCNPFEPTESICNMGTYVNYAVNVSTVAHVQAAIAFARQHNIRFVIRNTGHDYMGKSTGYGSLAIWTHHVKGMELIANYNTSYYSGPAVKGYAGTIVNELYSFTAEHGYLSVGGECPTVGWAGGYTSGGGHSALSSWKGLAADQTLEFEVILANGDFITASRTNNSDLWWALSGGGPGNYAVVWSMTAKIFPDVHVTSAVITAPQGTISNDTFWDFISFYHTLVPSYVDAGAYAYAFYNVGYFQLWPLFVPNKTTEEVNDLVAPLTAKLAELGFNFTSSIDTYPTFKQAYDASFGAINTGEFQFGGRLIPRSTLLTNGTALTNTVRHIAEGGAAIIEVGIAPSEAVGGNPGNSVLPAWRDSVMYIIPAAPWYDAAGSLEKNIAVRKTITYDWDEKLRQLAPNSGAYMSEADGDNPKWKEDWYGANYVSLLKIKAKYDKDKFFYAEKAVGSEYWSVDVDGKMCRAKTPGINK